MTEVQTLASKLQKAREAYYGTGSPIMSDAEYDALEDKLRALDPDNYVLRMVGAPPGENGWEKVKHSVAMGSLNKAQNKDETLAWLKGLNGRTEILLSEKLDGISCFPEGTPITLANGEQTPIQDIEVGAAVLTFKDGEQVTRKVLATYNNGIRQNWVKLHLEDGTTIITTEDHHFYVPEQGWVEAKNLEGLDLLNTVDD